MDTRELAREKCKTDWRFLSKVLAYDFQEDVHPDLFEAMPTPKPGVVIRDWSTQKNTLILWPRGHFKTSAVVLRIVQMILCDPDIRILIMQGSLKLSKKILKEAKSHFTGQNVKSGLPRLFPEFCGEKLGDAFEFTVPARVRKHLPAATVTVASPRATSTGQHYDVFFADDLVHANNFRNIDLLDKLESEFAHFVPLLDPGGYTVVTGTRYSHADIYGRIIARNKGEWTISVREAHDGNWVLLFPERVVDAGTRKIGFTKELLQQIERDEPETFYAQYMNRIIAAKAQLFPEPVLLAAVRSTKDPEYPAGGPCLFFLDLAPSKRAETDHSVLVIARVAPTKQVFVTDVIGSTYSPSAFGIVTINETIKHRPQRILIEKAAGAEYFAEYLQSIAREHGIALPIELVKASNQIDAKYLRIAALEGAFKLKRLFLMAGIRDFQRLVEEFTQFPKGRYDDRPDAIASLVQYTTNTFPIEQKRTSALPFFLQNQTAEPESEVSTNGMGYGFQC